MASLMDKFLITSMVLLALIPFDRVFLLKLGFVTLGAYELLYAVILLSSAILILLRGARRTGFSLMILWLSLSLFYFLLSPIVNNVSLSDAFRHLRFFLPFFVATFLLATPIRGNLEGILRNIVFATSVGALIAVVIHLALPDFLDAAFAASEEVVPIEVEHGRLYWGNALLCFIVITHYLAAKNKTALLHMAVLASILAMLMTLNRTMIVLLPVFFLAAHRHLTRSILKPVFALGMFVAISAILIVAFGDERLFSQFELRFLGRGDFSSVYENAIFITRFFYYDQYFQILTETFPVGQGLGLPLSRGPNDVFTTDISVLSFVLPFGLLGLVAFSSFITLVWRAFESPSWGSGYDEKLAATFRIMLIFLLLVSLNVDVFSRNIAVVFIAFLTSVLLSRRDARRGTSPSIYSPQFQAGFERPALPNSLERGS